jgi:hypothetical protein
MAAQQESFPGGLDLMAAQREWEDRERVLCKCFTSGGGFKWQSYIIGWMLIQMTKSLACTQVLLAFENCSVL